MGLLDRIFGWHTRDDLPGLVLSDGCAQLARLKAPVADYLAFENFEAFNAAMDSLLQARDFDARLSQRILQESTAPVVIAHCAVCHTDARFLIASEESYDAFRSSPNWRENPDL